MHTPREGKAALVTGAGGQDGVYLTQLLLDKGYIVHGLERDGSAESSERIASLGQSAPGRFTLHHGDLNDEAGLLQIVRDLRPDEIYNLAAQSSVQASFDAPEATFAVNVAGLAHLIEAILSLPEPRATRLFQASSSEIFGGGHAGPVNEQTPFNPQNPYAESKRQAHALVVEARRRHGLHASNGILFNHESPFRGEAFVTRKISLAVAAIHLGRQDRLTLGHLDSRRDWGHARDYVQAMSLMLQQPAPDDYVLATGTAASVRDFVAAAFARVGVQMVWRGAGLQEQGLCADTGRILVDVDPRFHRPAADSPIGDATKAIARLGWTARTLWPELAAEMVDEDLKRLAAQRPR